MMSAPGIAQSATSPMMRAEDERFAFLGANTPWVYSLAEALALLGCGVSAIATYDIRTYRRGNPQWPRREAPEGLRREYWVYPPGYAGTLSRLFAPVLYSRLVHSFPPVMGARNDFPWIIAPYPWFARTLRKVPANRLIYYNLDDYVLYQPSRRKSILAQEAELVERAAIVLCLSESQARSLKDRFPSRAASIFHFPLGVVESLLNPTPVKLASQPPVVGYVGNLIDRVDWLLVADVARRLPDVEFQFVGGLDGFSGGGARLNWQQDRAAALALPNVRHIGPVSQDEVGAYYWKFSATWIPYALDHAFNRAACPTKIMDGLASGRPVLSTDVPECRLYPDFISIFHSTEDATSQIKKALDVANAPEAMSKAARQTQFVLRNHLWSERAHWLLASLVKLPNA